MVVEGEFVITVVGACVAASLNTPRKVFLCLGLLEFFLSKVTYNMNKNYINIKIISCYTACITKLILLM